MNKKVLAVVGIVCVALAGVWCFASGARGASGGGGAMWASSPTETEGAGGFSSAHTNERLEGKVLASGDGRSGTVAPTGDGRSGTVAPAGSDTSTVSSSSGGSGDGRQDAAPTTVTLSADAEMTGRGFIIEPRSAAFSEGETVFDVLARECRAAGLPMAFRSTPVYGSAYVEGIGGLFEFDEGELSGWMYSVNGAFPNFGCSQYVLKDGDVVAWRYTLDLGADIGGGGVVQG